MVEFDYWDTPMKLFVADAKYRGLDLAYDTTSRSHGNPQLDVTRGYFNISSDTRTEALPYIKNDTWIKRTYAALRNDGTAKSNTDFLMRFNTTQAAHHCRDQDIPGVGQLDLPNLYELIILYLESDNIDALDPTAESNSDKALGKMNTHGRFNYGNAGYVWCSTGYGTYRAWNVDSKGRAYNYFKNRSYSVAPVKELIGV